MQVYYNMMNKMQKQSIGAPITMIGSFRKPYLTNLSIGK